MELQFKVEGMSCEGCKNSVKTTLNNDDRIEKTDVELDSGLVTIEASEEMDVQTINALLADTPYNAVAQ